MTSSQVNYLARCGNFVEKGLAYKGTLRTLKVILGYDYLSDQCPCQGRRLRRHEWSRTVWRQLFRFRDPNLRETNERFTRASCRI